MLAMVGRVIWFLVKVKPLNNNLGEDVFLERLLSYHSNLFSLNHKVIPICEATVRNDARIIIALANRSDG
jgi:hypothetical protein